MVQVAEDRNRDLVALKVERVHGLQRYLEHKADSTW